MTADLPTHPSTEAERRVERWNASVVVGAPCHWWTLMDRSGEKRTSATRSKAWVLGDQPVVMVEGLAGGLHLDCVEPLPVVITAPSTEAVGEVRRDPRYDLSAEAQKLRYAVAEAVAEVDRQWCANIDGAGVDSAIAATITQLRSDLSAMTSDRDWLKEELGKAAAEIAELREGEPFSFDDCRVDCDCGGHEGPRSCGCHVTGAEARQWIRQFEAERAEVERVLDEIEDRAFPDEILRTEGDYWLTVLRRSVLRLRDALSPKED